MNKEFIPYEQALELKELGFNENCLAFYNFEERLMPIDTDFTNFRELSDDLIKAPLYQQAFRWFREKHNIYCSIGIYNNSVITANVAQPTQITWVLDSPTFEQAQNDSLNKIIEVVKYGLPKKIKIEDEDEDDEEY